MLKEQSTNIKHWGTLNTEAQKHLNAETHTQKKKVKRVKTIYT